MTDGNKDRLIMVGAMVGILGLLIGFVLWPQQATLRDLKSEKVLSLNMLDANAQQQAIVPELIEQVETMKAEYEGFSQRLPEQAGLGDFLQQINESLAEEGLASEWIRPGDSVAGELFHSMPVDMRFQGTYLATVRFLERLESMERLVRVHELEITGGQDGENGNVNVEMQINIYYTKTDHG
jgi:Tfp pilus assembly protein PilO